MAQVRLRMGQTQMATDLLDRLLAAYPNHVGGLMAKGMALLRIGNPAGAVELWEHALAAAGGSHKEIERLLSVSKSARGEEPPAPPRPQPTEPVRSDLSAFLAAGTSKQPDN
jgi:predicted Zn-dependent protease